MGHGIAQMAAMTSFPEATVVALEIDQGTLDAGRRRIDQSISKMISKEVKGGSLTAPDADRKKEEILSRISYVTDKDALSQCDIVIEAIAENPGIKLPFYGDLGRITPSHCVLASNTSSLKIMVSGPN